MIETTNNAANTVEEVAAVAKPEVTSFHFKSTDVTVKDGDTEKRVLPIGKNEKGEDVFGADGNALIAAGWKYTSKGWKRPSIDVELPKVTDDEVLNIIANGGQGKQFLLAVCAEQFYNAARTKINEILTENKLAVVTADTVKAFGLAWDSMAASYLEAAASARATGIAKEVWDDFVNDYVLVMTRELPTNGEEKIKNAAEHLKLRFAKCRSDKMMLSKLQGYLGLWYSATSRQEEFTKLFTNLDDRAKVLLETNDIDSI